MNKKLALIVSTALICSSQSYATGGRPNGITSPNNTVSGQTQTGRSSGERPALGGTASQTGADVLGGAPRRQQPQANAPAQGRSQPQTTTTTTRSTPQRPQQTVAAVSAFAGLSIPSNIGSMNLSQVDALADRVAALITDADRAANSKVDIFVGAASAVDADFIATSDDSTKGRAARFLSLSVSGLSNNQSITKSTALSAISRGVDQGLVAIGKSEQDAVACKAKGG